MNQSKSVTGFKLLTSLVILSIAAIAALAFASYARSSVSHANTGNGPTFNRLATNFEIQTDDQGTINNVSSSGGRWEKDFFRVGNSWNRQGDFSTNNSRLEVCDSNATFALWGYVHNTRSVGLNHDNEDALDFQGPAVARNTTVTITSEDLDADVFANSHTITLTITADNAVTKTDTVEIYCDKHAIKLASTGTATPQVHTWSAESINKVRHDRAVEVFGADYSITNPGDIFTTGSKIGYDGNLPGCRYYAAYLEAELKVIADGEPAPQTGSIGSEIDPQTEVRSAALPDTGLESSNGLNYSLIALIAGSAIALAITQRAVVARVRRGK